MNKNCVYNRSYFLLISIIIYFSNNVVFANTHSPKNKNEIDSIATILTNCNDDSTKVRILSKQFRKYQYKDFTYSKYYGEWISKSFMKSDNIFSKYTALYILAEISLEEEKFDTALFYFRKALDLAQTRLHKAWCYFHLGKINNQYGNFSISKNQMRNAARFFAHTRDSTWANTAQDYVAATFEHFQQYDSLLDYQNKRLELFRKQNDKFGETKMYWQLAETYSYLDDVQKTIEYFKKALLLAKENGDSVGMGYLYTSIGDFFVKNHKYYNIAIEYYTKGLKSYKTDIHVAEHYCRLADLYRAQDNDSMAMVYYKKSLKLAEQLNEKHLISIIQKGYGFLYKKNGNDSLAIDYFNKCYITGCPNCPKIVFYDALVEIADLYLKTNKRDEAYKYYSRAFDLAIKFHALNELALSNLKLGNFYASNDAVFAEKYYLDAIIAVRKTRNTSLYRSISDTLSNLYQHINEYKFAYQYQKIARRLSDSIATTENKTNMADLAMKFEFDKLESENISKQELSLAEIKKQKIYRNFFVIISILLVAMGLFIYASYRRKKNDNLLLSSQKKQIENKNKEILDQVEEITIQKNKVEKISKKLHETDKSKLRFFTNLSHEFRTPITLILLPIEKLLKSIKKNGPLHKQYQLIYGNALKIKQLTDQIIDLRKLDDNLLNLEYNHTNILEIFRETTLSFEDYCHKYNCSLSFSSNITSLSALADREKLQSILSNLLSNAFKYNKINGSISVDICVLENNLKLKVKDSGIGISAEKKDKIFQRYYKINNSENEIEGTGIGLAYVKEIIQLMNGTIHVESEIDKGTEILIELPIKQAKVIDNTTQEFKILPKTDLTNFESFEKDSIIQNSKERTILIVEDNVDLRDSLNQIFEEKYTVITAVNGNEGLKMAMEHTPDIILSDIMMPKMNGNRLCEILKQDEHTSHIPIVLLTAMATELNHLNGYQAGADDYILKPFNPEILTYKIENILSTRDSLRKRVSFTPTGISNTSDISDIDKRFITNCIAIINKNIENSNFTVDQLAKDLGFSTRNFYRKVKALVNVTPSEFIRNFKMQHASSLLIKKNARVSDVALLVGFEDIKSFSQAFKKHFGQTPSAYIQNKATT